MKPLTYEERSEYCCDVCGSVPDEDGVIEHGKGCYTQSEDGGGTSFVEFDPPGEAIMAEPDRYDETAAKLLPPGIFGTEPGRAFFAEARRREVAAAMREAAASAPADPRKLLAELPCGRDGGLPQKPGWYLWHRSDVSYLEVGVVQILKDSESHIAYLRGQMANGKDARQFYLYQNDSGEWLTLYHSAYPHVLPTCDPSGKPYVDGYEPFDWYWRDLGLAVPPAHREPRSLEEIRKDQERDTAALAELRAKVEAIVAAAAPAEPLRKLLAECRRKMPKLCGGWTDKELAELYARIDAALAAPPVSAWRPISEEPDCKFVLLAGRNDDDGWWRDVGVYAGTDETGRIFRDKYGSGSHPTHWMPLPAPPEGHQ